MLETFELAGVFGFSAEIKVNQLYIFCKIN